MAAADAATAIQAENSRLLDPSHPPSAQPLTLSFQASKMIIDNQTSTRACDLPSACFTCAFYFLVRFALLLINAQIQYFLKLL